MRAKILPCILLSLLTQVTEAYFANWGEMGRSQEPTCVDIPANISLCSNIQYKRMRLPNLLAHDTLNEVAHQSSSWIPLLNVGCHPDTQLFLCSLFTPVCLESPIYPCRSLCVAVQTACESRMTTYGYNWPDMLSCSNFPEDNDMCVMAQHEGTQAPDKPEETEVDIHNPSSTCPVCEPVPTYENILDHFCRADFVLRVRIRAVRNGRIIARKARVFKPVIKPGNGDQGAVRAQRQALKKPTLLLIGDSACCTEALSSPSGRYLVMGKNTSEGMQPTFVLPWTRQRSIREATRLFAAGLDCSDPSLFTPDQQSGAILNTAHATTSRGNQTGRRRGGRRRQREGRRGERRGRRRGSRGRKTEADKERRRENRRRENRNERQTKRRQRNKMNKKVPAQQLE